MQRIAEALGARVRGDRGADRPGGRDAGQALEHHPGGAAGDDLRLDAPVAGRDANGRRRSATRWSSASPSASSAAITPWNYPLHQIAAKVAPAMAAGCTVVLKPSQVAPLNAVLLADVLDEVGLPAGVFNLVTGRGSVIGEALARHPDVDMVSFTGSTAAGTAGQRSGCRHDQACGARARRQVAERDPRGCRLPGRDPGWRGASVS